MIKSSLVKAIKEYMGFKPGQTLTEFMQEIKQLTAEDRDYLKREFVKVGYEITD